jgi:hypothetical protein
MAGGILRRLMGVIGVGALLWAATAFTACGGDDESHIRAAIDEIRQAYLAQDYGAVCSQMSEAARMQAGSIGHGPRLPCERGMRRNMSATILSPGDVVEPKVERIEIEGDHATVLAKLGGRSMGTVRLVKRHGEWKLAQLFGTSGRATQLQ